MESKSGEYSGPERRRWIRISAGERAEILRSAARTADIAISEATRGMPERVRDLVWQDVNVQVGKVAIRISLYVAGTAIVATLAWLGLHEKITMGGG